MKHKRCFELKPHAVRLPQALSMTLVPSPGVLSGDELLIEFHSTAHMIILDLQCVWIYTIFPPALLIAQASFENICLVIIWCYAIFMTTTVHFGIK